MSEARDPWYEMSGEAGVPIFSPESCASTRQGFQITRLLDRQVLVNFH